MSAKVSVTAKFFASIREVVGQGKLNKEIKQGTTASNLWVELCDEYPGLKELENQIIIAVNKDTGKKDKVLEDGDEIAFLPPVSGG